MCHRRRRQRRQRQLERAVSACQSMAQSATKTRKTLISAQDLIRTRQTKANRFDPISQWLTISQSTRRRSSSSSGQQVQRRGEPPIKRPRPEPAPSERFLLRPIGCEQRPPEVRRLAPSFRRLRGRGRRRGASGGRASSAEETRLAANERADDDQKVSPSLGSDLASRAD